MTTKIHLKAGDVDFVYETDTPIAVSDVSNFISQVQDLAQAIGQPSPASAPGTSPSSATPPKPLMIEHSKIDLHVNTIAERLNCKNAAELAFAAAAYLQIVGEKESFSRREWLEAMQAATNFYNKNMSGNFSRTVGNLTGSKINQLSNDRFAIKASELPELRGKLAE